MQHNYISLHGFCIDFPFIAFYNKGKCYVHFIKVFRALTNRMHCYNLKQNIWESEVSSHYEGKIIYKIRRSFR